MQLMEKAVGDRPIRMWNDVLWDRGLTELVVLQDAWDRREIAQRQLLRWISGKVSTVLFDVSDALWRMVVADQPATSGDPRALKIYEEMLEDSNASDALAVFRTANQLAVAQRAQLLIALTTRA